MANTPSLESAQSWLQSSPVFMTKMLDLKNFILFQMTHLRNDSLTLVTTKDVFITLSSETRQRTLKPMSQLRKQASITTAKCFPEGCIESLSMYYVIYIAKYEHKI